MTMRELLAKIKRELSDDFCGKELDNVADHNIRLRSYDSKLKVMQKPYEDKPELGKDNPIDQTLVHYNFHSHFELKIEIR